MRTLILLSLICCSLCAQDFPDAYDISQKEFQELFADTKREIADRTGWKSIDTWFVNLDGPDLSDGESTIDFYKEVRSSWAASSAKIFLPPPPLSLSEDEAGVEFKHPTMNVKIRRILEDVVLIQVGHGYPLAGGTFELVYRKEAERWKLANVLRGGIR